MESLWDRFQNLCPSHLSPRRRPFIICVTSRPSHLTAAHSTVMGEYLCVSGVGRLTDTCREVSQYVGRVRQPLIRRDADLFEQPAASHQYTYVRLEWRPSRDKYYRRQTGGSEALAAHRLVCTCQTPFTEAPRLGRNVLAPWIFIVRECQRKTEHLRGVMSRCLTENFWLNTVKQLEIPPCRSRMVLVENWLRGFRFFWGLKRRTHIIRCIMVVTEIFTCLIQWFKILC